MPYLYTLAEEAHRTGWPMMRPLFWPTPEDQSLWGIDDSFLLGDNLLVAPIVNEGDDERTIQLPAGNWVDYWTEQHYEGSMETTVPGPLDRIPLLVRSGAVLPHENNGELVLHLFPPDPQGGTIESDLYLDEGDGYGPWRRDTFSCQPTSEGWRIDWRVEGEYPFAYPRLSLQFHPPLPGRVELDGHPIQLEGDRISIEPFEQLNCRKMNTK
jgi:alpha-glucosidase